jgi:hypothetical protein
MCQIPRTQENRVRRPFVQAFILAWLVLLSFPAASDQKEAETRGEGCLSCHKGIETINEKMAAAWRADKKCEVCHYGQPTAATKLEAHRGIIANPGDLRVIERTCGKCHSDYGEIQNVQINGIDNHVGRVVRSLMATAAGEIAGTRYLWNEQKSRSAIYGIRAVFGLNHPQPEGAVAHLQELPPASNSDADSLLRGACLRCHLWTDDKASAGIFRPGGCSACHVLYDEDGLSRSGDPTVPKDEPGHPIEHMITTSIPTSQCLWCHNDGGGRIGLSYAGLAVTDPSLGQRAAAPGEKTAYGVGIMHVNPDVHFRRGISCIDCHDTVDLHGDGNTYSHQEYQVAIRCESCHGSATKPPSFRTERGDAIRNVEIEEGKPYLRTKIFLERHPIPVLYSEESSSWLANIWHKGHQRLECYACHSTSTPQCYVCHMVRDDSKTSRFDWVAGIGERQQPEGSVGLWTGRKFFQLWNDSILGVNRRGRIAPFVPGGQAIFTHLDPKGNILKINQVFTTSAGLYGFSLNPIQPHNISAESRTCESCHSNKKAMGLGTPGFADLKRLGLSWNFSPDAFVDEEGGRIQDSGHESVRPLNEQELSAIFRTGSCIDCHREPDEQARLHRERGPCSLKEGDTMHHKAIEDRLSSQEE